MSKVIDMNVWQYEKTTKEYLSKLVSERYEKTTKVHALIAEQMISMGMLLNEEWHMELTSKLSSVSDENLDFFIAAWGIIREGDTTLLEDIVAAIKKGEDITE